MATQGWRLGKLNGIGDSLYLFLWREEGGTLRPALSVCWLASRDLKAKLAIQLVSINRQQFWTEVCGFLEA